MAIDIRIDFENNPDGIFYAGQLLLGVVRLTLTEEMSVRGVYIRIYGKGHCDWTTGSGDDESRHTGYERYIDETTYLLGSKNGNLKLIPGTQTYDFQCSLPNELPTSVQGKQCYYMIEECK